MWVPAMVQVWRSEDNFQESVLSFHRVGLSNQSGCQLVSNLHQPLGHLSPFLILSDSWGPKRSMSLIILSNNSNLELLFPRPPIS